MRFAIPAANSLTRLSCSHSVARRCASAFLWACRPAGWLCRRARAAFAQWHGTTHPSRPYPTGRDALAQPQPEYAFDQPMQW